MADFITQFTAEEYVNRDNFNSRITQANTGLTTVQNAAVAAQTTANNAVPKTRKINGKALSGDVVLTAADVGSMTYGWSSDLAGLNVLDWAKNQPISTTLNVSNTAAGFPFAAYWRVELAVIGAWKVLRATNINWAGGQYTNVSYDGGISWVGWIGAASLDTYGKVKPEQASSTIISRPASYTLSLTDAGTFNWCGNNNDPITVTIPANATVPFPVGTEIEFGRGAPGTLTFAAASGVNILSIDNMRSVANWNGCAALKQVATNYWLLSGDLG